MRAVAVFPLRMPIRRQRGLALPVVLIILAVMLVSSIYLMKSIHSTTLATGNLAYDATLSQSVDLGLHTGFEWLKTTATADKTALDADSPANGYMARMNTSLSPRDEGFWDAKKTIAGPDGLSIDYVIHRMCQASGAYDTANQCVQTAANTSLPGTSVGVGTSLASDTPAYAGSPQVHYVITARLRGAKGASVVNQMVVLIGA
jgi:Tfp pilus assembly protein PilX